MSKPSKKTIKDEILESFRSHIPLARPLAVKPPNVLVQVPLRWLAIAAAEMAGMKHELGQSSSVELTREQHLHWCAIHIGKTCNCHSQMRQEKASAAPLADRLAILGYGPWRLHDPMHGLQRDSRWMRDKHALRCHRCALKKDAENGKGD